MPLSIHPRDAVWGDVYYPDMLCDGTSLPARLCVAGSIVASNIRSVNETHSEAAIELDLFRLVDIESMIELRTRANPANGEHVYFTVECRR